LEKRRENDFRTKGPADTLKEEKETITQLIQRQQPAKKKDRQLSFQKHEETTKEKEKNGDGLLLWNEASRGTKMPARAVYLGGKKKGSGPEDLSNTGPPGGGRQHGPIKRDSKIRRKKSNFGIAGVGGKGEIEETGGTKEGKMSQVERESRSRQQRRRKKYGESRGGVRKRKGDMTKKWRENLSPGGNETAPCF